MFKFFVFDFNFYRYDLREFDAAIYHILINLTNDKNKELDYIHVFRIIALSNYYYCKYHFSNIFPEQYLVYLDNVDFKITNFERNWKIEYKLTQNGYISKKRRNIIGYTDYTYKDYLSEATLNCLNKATKRYKFYDKYVLHLMDFYYNLIYKMRNKINIRIFIGNTKQSNKKYKADWLPIIKK